MKSSTLALLLLALVTSGCRATTPRFALPASRDSQNTVAEFKHLEAQFDALKVYEQSGPRVATARQ